MRTKGLRIGTLITPVARRRPQKLARETVTLDHLSAGRLTLGVGLGVPAESEFARFGEEADGRIRAEKLDEGLAVLARFWSGEPFSFEGKHVRIRDMAFLPTPVQRPRIPIWVGGEWPNKAPMRRAARWDGVVPVSPGWPDEVLTPDDYRALLQYIGAHRREAGPFEVAFMTSWAGDRPGNDSATLAAYADAGVTWWLQEADGLASARKWLRAGPPRS